MLFSKSKLKAFTLFVFFKVGKMDITPETIAATLESERELLNSDGDMKQEGKVC